VPQILCYAGQPIAVIEILPNSILGKGELCYRLSPDEGDADIVEVSDTDLATIRRGEFTGLLSSPQE